MLTFEWFLLSFTRFCAENDPILSVADGAYDRVPMDWDLRPRVIGTYDILGCINAHGGGASLRNLRFWNDYLVVSDLGD